MNEVMQAAFYDELEKIAIGFADVTGALRSGWQGMNPAQKGALIGAGVGGLGGIAAQQATGGHGGLGGAALAGLGGAALGAGAGGLVGVGAQMRPAINMVGKYGTPIGLGSTVGGGLRSGIQGIM